MVGACEMALRPTCLRSSGESSPLLAASGIFDATCVRAPISRCERSAHASSRTARESALVAASNMRRGPQRGKALIPALFCRFGDPGISSFAPNASGISRRQRLRAGPRADRKGLAWAQRRCWYRRLRVKSQATLLASYRWCSAAHRRGTIGRIPTAAAPNDSLRLSGKNRTVQSSSASSTTETSRTHGS
jgi:hypothetical protein